MNDAIYWAIAICVLIPFAAGVVAGVIVTASSDAALPVLEPGAAVIPEIAEEVEMKEFPVAGKRRKPTWRERRRLLESQARTKREKLEEWRD